MMIQNNIDLSLKVFNSGLEFIVNDNEVKIVLDKDLKVSLNFNTLENTIVINKAIKDVEEDKNYVDEDTIKDKARRLVTLAKEKGLVKTLSDIDSDSSYKDYIEDNTYIENESDEQVNAPDTTIKPLDSKKEPEVYWENGILKHKETESIENPEESKQGDIIIDLPKSAKRGRKPQTTYCPYCGDEVNKDNKFMINGKVVCSRCTNKLKEQLKRDILKKKESDE